MELKVDCYILRAKIRGVHVSWVFLCKQSPSEVTEKEVVQGVMSLLSGAAFTIDEIDEIKIEKKTVVVKGKDIRW